MSGYHKKNIKKGKLGEISKIAEEFEELMDANEQGARILELCEVADLYGAIKAYVKEQFNLSMDDVKIMSELTERAFLDGSRT